MHRRDAVMFKPLSYRGCYAQTPDDMRISDDAQSAVLVLLRCRLALRCNLLFLLCTSADRRLGAIRYTIRKRYAHVPADMR